MARLAMSLLVAEAGRDDADLDADGDVLHRGTL